MESRTNKNINLPRYACALLLASSLALAACRREPTPYTTEGRTIAQLREDRDKYLITPEMFRNILVERGFVLERGGYVVTRPSKEVFKLSWIRSSAPTSFDDIIKEVSAACGISSVSSQAGTYGKGPVFITVLNGECKPELQLYSQ
jgi:hypothetical protein